MLFTGQIRSWIGYHCTFLPDLKESVRDPILRPAMILLFIKEVRSLLLSVTWRLTCIFLMAT
jgi:hypothetical protein